MPLALIMESVDFFTVGVTSSRDVSFCQLQQYIASIMVLPLSSSFHWQRKVSICDSMNGFPLGFSEVIAEKFILLLFVCSKWNMTINWSIIMATLLFSAWLWLLGHASSLSSDVSPTLLWQMDSTREVTCIFVTLCNKQSVSTNKAPYLLVRIWLLGHTFRCRNDWCHSFL